MNKNIKKLDLQTLLAPAVLIVVFIIFCVLSANFRTMSNFMSILLTASVSGVLAIGMTYCVIGGGMDISVGTTMRFCNGNDSYIHLQNESSYYVRNYTGNFVRILCRIN